jgi:hypothetical protein
MECGMGTIVREAVEEMQEDSRVQIIVVRLCFVNARRMALIIALLCTMGLAGQ